MSASDYLEGKILDHVFHGAAFTQPTIYVGLSTADPLDSGAGLAEPSGNGYARVAVAAWTKSGTTKVNNTNNIEFPEATGSWGTVTHGCIFDAATAGNLLLSFALDAPQTITTGQIARFNAGELEVTCD